MRNLKYLLCAFCFLGCSLLLNAQNEGKSPVGQFMRSNERSYVVIAVMLTILIGLILYMVRLDRKISKLENEK